MIQKNMEESKPWSIHGYLIRAVNQNNVKIDELFSDKHRFWCWTDIYLDYFYKLEANHLKVKCLQKPCQRQTMCANFAECTAKTLIRLSKTSNDEDEISNIFFDDLQNQDKVFEQLWAVLEADTHPSYSYKVQYHSRLALFYSAFLSDLKPPPDTCCVDKIILKLKEIIVAKHRHPQVTTLEQLKQHMPIQLEPFDNHDKQKSARFLTGNFDIKPLWAKNRIPRFPRFYKLSGCYNAEINTPTPFFQV